jgi:ribonucleoside-diphosphate reductase beta chain
MNPHRTTFTTTRTGLDRQLYPMRLWQKAKRLGTWDPAAIDFTADAADWKELTEPEQDLLLRLTAQFQGGEESVTYDLLPLLQVMAEAGRIEEEMFLTSYLWEEAKHVEGFGRFLRDVAGAEGNLDHYFTDAYRHIFFDALPNAMHRLRSDASPTTLAEAAVTYQMIVEGVLAETGYEAYYTVLEANDILPGMQTFVRHVQRDEARHVGYGVFLLARLVAEHGDPVWDAIDARMNRLLPFALQHIEQTLAPYGNEVPFGITPDDFIEVGIKQFENRFSRIERARSQTLDDVYYGHQASASEPEAGTPDGTSPAQPPPGLRT